MSVSQLARHGRGGRLNVLLVIIFRPNAQRAQPTVKAGTGEIRPKARVEADARVEAKSKV